MSNTQSILRRPSTRLFGHKVLQALTGDREDGLRPSGGPMGNVTIGVMAEALEDR